MFIWFLSVKFFLIKVISRQSIFASSCSALHLKDLSFIFRQLFLLVFLLFFLYLLALIQLSSLLNFLSGVRLCFNCFSICLLLLCNYLLIPDYGLDYSDCRAKNALTLINFSLWLHLAHQVIRSRIESIFEFICAPESNTAIGHNWEERMVRTRLKAFKSLVVSLN